MEYADRLGSGGLRLLIAGGGTGGHVIPAIAVAREWLGRDEKRDVGFVGTQRGIESRLRARGGFPAGTDSFGGSQGYGYSAIHSQYFAPAAGVLGFPGHPAPPSFRRGFRRR